MAESTCVMHPFSYTSPENHFHEESPMYGIRESVSFGRYVTEDLEWEKWSSFESNNNRNRYVKEAEKYSKPGSVAQKKAYFEAHFKRMAALKAAALLEQANNAAQNNNATSNESVKVQVNDVHGDGLVKSGSNNEGNDFEGAKMIGSEDENCDESDDAGKFVVYQNELYLIAVDGGENDNGGGNDVGLGVVNQNSCDKIEVYSASTKVDDWKASNEEKPLLQENSYANDKAATATATAMTKKNPPLSSYILKEVDVRDKMFAFSPAKSANAIHPGKETYATPVKKQSSVSDFDKKKTPLRMSINRELNRIISPVIKKLGSSSKASTPSKASVNSTPQRPCMTPDLTRRGASPSPSTGRSKISSPIIPNSFCLKNGDRTARRKQKLEDKFNATATEKPSQPSKFKVKAEAELNKFRQSFCFKAMSSPDYYGDNGTLRSPKDKKESTLHKSPDGGRQSNRTLLPQNTNALPPRRPASKQIGLKSKRTLVTS